MTKFTKKKLLVHWDITQKGKFIGASNAFGTERALVSFVHKIFDFNITYGVNLEVSILLTPTGNVVFGRKQVSPKVVYVELFDPITHAKTATSMALFNFLYNRVQFFRGPSGLTCNLKMNATNTPVQSSLLHTVDVSHLPSHALPQLATPQVPTSNSKACEQTKGIMGPEFAGYVRSFTYSTEDPDKNLKWQVDMQTGKAMVPLHDLNYEPIDEFDEELLSELPELRGFSPDDMAFCTAFHMSTLVGASQMDIPETLDVEDKDVVAPLPKYMPNDIPDLHEKSFYQEIPNVIAPSGQTVGLDNIYTVKNAPKEETIPQATKTIYDHMLSIYDSFYDKFGDNPINLDQFLEHYKTFRETKGAKTYLPVFCYVFNKLEVWARKKLGRKGSRLIWAPTVFEWLLGMICTKANHESAKCQLWKGNAHGIISCAGGFELFLQYLSSYEDAPQYSRSVRRMVKKSKPLFLPTELLDKWFKDAIDRQAGKDDDFQNWDLSLFAMYNNGYYRYILASYRMDFQKLRWKDIVFLSFLFLVEEYNTTKLINLNGVIVATHRVLASGVSSTAHEGSFINDWLQRTHAFFWLGEVRLLMTRIREFEKATNFDTSNHKRVKYNNLVFDQDPQWECFYPREAGVDPFHALKTSILTALRSMKFVHFSDDYFANCDWLAVPVLEILDKNRMFSHMFGQALHANDEVDIDREGPYDEFHMKVLEQIVSMMPNDLKKRQWHGIELDPPRRYTFPNAGAHTILTTGNIRYRIKTYLPLITEFDYSDDENQAGFADNLVGNWDKIRSAFIQILDGKKGQIKQLGVNFLKNYFVRFGKNIIGMRKALDMVPRIYLPTTTTSMDVDSYTCKRLYGLLFNCAGHPYTYALIRTIINFCINNILMNGNQPDLNFKDPIDQAKWERKIFQKFGDNAKIDFSTLTYDSLMKFMTKQNPDHGNIIDFIYRHNARKTSFIDALIPLEKRGKNYTKHITGTEYVPYEFKWNPKPIIA